MPILMLSQSLPIPDVCRTVPQPRTVTRGTLLGDEEELEDNELVLEDDNG